MAKTAFTAEQEAEVVELYLSGLSTGVIAGRMGRSREPVLSCLKRHAIQMRSQCHQMHIDLIREQGSLADRVRGMVRVNKETGCWEFIGTPDAGTGYGKTSICRLRTSLHRLAWMAWCGPIPHGLEVCHRCDNRICGNPEHLFLGTRRDNVQDAKQKGRLSSGERHGLKLRGENAPQAKLTWDKVRAIRRAVAEGVDRQTIATQYGISASNVWVIARGETWREGWAA